MCLGERGVHQKFQNKIYQRRIKNALLPLLLSCDRARFCQNILTLGRCFYKNENKKINRERRSIRVKHQNSGQNFCKFFCFCEIGFSKSYHFCQENFPILQKNKKIFVKKHLPKVQNRANLNTKISRPFTQGLTVYVLFSFL